MFALIFECGRVTSSWYAELALRRRVKKSAIGSVMVMTAGVTFLAAVPGPGPAAHLFLIGLLDCVLGYQLDFCTPGSSPACAISRRQMRHSPNLR